MSDYEFDLDDFHLKIVYAQDFPNPQYENDLIEAAEEALATIETLRRRVAELEGERDRWKSAHHEMVDRNKLLRDRPDLPIERLQAYKQITAENAELKRQVEALREDAEVGRLLDRLQARLKVLRPFLLEYTKQEGGEYLVYRVLRGDRTCIGRGGSLLEALREAAKGQVEG